MKVLGIDPGVTTGVAVWDAAGQALTLCDSMSIHHAMDMVRNLERGGDVDLVIYEDAHLRKWYGKTSREMLQGAGSVKRDCTIWRDFLTDLRIPFAGQHPAATKWTHREFCLATGWATPTNEHKRDAALIVFGLTLPYVSGLLRTMHAQASPRTQAGR